jgi:hypothetical protein
MFRDMLEAQISSCCRALEELSHGQLSLDIINADEDLQEVSELAAHPESSEETGQSHSDKRKVGGASRVWMCTSVSVSICFVCDWRILRNSHLFACRQKPSHIGTPLQTRCSTATIQTTAIFTSGQHAPHVGEHVPLGSTQIRRKTSTTHR